MTLIQYPVIMDCKIIIGMLLMVSSTLSEAQKKKLFTPPDMTPKNYTIVVPELQLDSTFTEGMDTILFNKKCHWRDRENSDFKSWLYFYIAFIKKDSLSYSIYVELWDTPFQESVGFFKHNEYFYFLYGEVPSNIVLKTKLNKQFSYTVNPPYPIEPPSWRLTYNNKMNNIIIKDMYCY